MCVCVCARVCVCVFPSVCLSVCGHVFWGNEGYLCAVDTNDAASLFLYSFNTYETQLMFRRNINVAWCFDSWLEIYPLVLRSVWWHPWWARGPPVWFVWGLNLVHDMYALCLLLHAVSHPGRRQPGSISDYDPLNQNFGSITTDPRQAGYTAHPEPVRQPAPPAQPAYQPPPPRKFRSSQRQERRPVEDDTLAWIEVTENWINKSNKKGRGQARRDDEKVNMSGGERRKVSR